MSGFNRSFVSCVGRTANRQVEQTPDARADRSERGRCGFRRRASHRRLNRGRSGSQRSRRGAAAIEFAVCIPVLLLLIMGSIEGSSLIFLKQSLNVAAYEASREAIRNGRSNADASGRAEAILAARNVQDFAITSPNGESQAIDRGELVVTQITAPSGVNSPLFGQYLSNRDVVVRVTMMKQ